MDDQVKALGQSGGTFNVHLLSLWCAYLDLREQQGEHVSAPTARGPRVPVQPGVFFFLVDSFLASRALWLILFLSGAFTEQLQKQVEDLQNKLNAAKNAQLSAQQTGDTNAVRLGVLENDLLELDTKCQDLENQNRVLTPFLVFLLPSLCLVVQAPVS